ncbi:MFS transporter [Lacrimispora sp. BS-2]|uniref:MFS transporter n=1 Tax=Lacrimispora sp. BS-2 TaxID=3151850 RepID=A0AAU7PJU6_9FIRM
MDKNKTFHLFGAIIAAGILAFSGVLIETAMNVTFPLLIQEFRVTTSGIQWVTTIYLLMISVIVPISSYLNQNFSARNLFITANLFFLLGVLINCFSSSFSLLLLGRLLQGVGTGIGLPLMFHIILTKAPVEKRGMMMGIGTLTTSIAPAIGPTYGGLISNLMDWRYIYIFLIPLMILSLTLGLHSIPSEASREKQHLHFRCVFFLAITFTSFIMALSAGSGITFALFFVIGLASALLFLLSNRKTPLLQISVLKNSRFSAFLFSLLIYQALLLGLSFVLPNYLQISAGFRSSAAGAFMFPGALMGALLAPLSGRLLDRIGANKPILIGLFTTIVGITMLIVLLHTNSLVLLIGAHLILMTGLGLSYSNLMTCSLSALPSSQISDGNAFVNTFQQFIGAVATALVAAIFSFFQNKYGFISGTASGAWIVLLIFFLLLVTSTIVAFSALKKKNYN